MKHLMRSIVLASILAGMSAGTTLAQDTGDKRPRMGTAAAAAAPAAKPEAPTPAGKHACKDTSGGGKPVDCKAKGGKDGGADKN